MSDHFGTLCIKGLMGKTTNLSHQPTIRDHSFGALVIFAEKLIFLRIWLHLLKKFIMENFTFCVVTVKKNYRNKFTILQSQSNFLDQV